MKPEKTDGGRGGGTARAVEPAGAAIASPATSIEPGVRRSAGGHRFTLFAPHARRVELELRALPGQHPFTAHLHLEVDETADGWWAAGARSLPEAFEYFYRVDGGPELIDPYSTLLSGGELWGDRSWEAAGRPFRPYRSLWSERHCALAGAPRPNRPRVSERERVIYELHLRGFTRHASSGVVHPGTYLGLIEKIPYLQSLGVTTVELLPVFEFDETENQRRNPHNGETLLNYWGYSPITFFAPKRSYAAGAGVGAELDELVLLVDELHRAGMEIVLDVVFNHTAEGGGGGRDPLRSFRALADDVYYLRDRATGRPFDCTGCGNSVNTNHPVVRRMIVDSLAFWAGEVGVDGFRFDLASVFYRGEQGEKLERSPVADEIAAEPRLAGRLLIAEPWDITGFSPPHGFPPPWKEWNGAFRDACRRYARGDEVAPRTLAQRLGGSPDRTPSHAPPRAGSTPVDFVTCHDGFTLADLVAYEQKHNEANGENGQDGSGFNLSSNQGVEGESADEAVIAQRDRQVLNLLSLLFLTRATPMLLAGDERARTQRGNNNPWCQDNELSWLDWSAGDRGRLEQVRLLIELRRELAAFEFGRFAELSAFVSREPGHPGQPAKPALLLFRGDDGAAGEHRDLALALNPTAHAVRLPLPRCRPPGIWSLALDSARTPPIAARTARPLLAADTVELELQPRSLRLLLGGGRSESPR